MAKLQELIKGFRANVREGNPCELRFDGRTITLCPLPFDKYDCEAETKYHRAYVGLTTKPSTK